MNKLNKYNPNVTTVRANSLDLEGIIDFERFESIKILYCYYNRIKKLKNLPNTLVHLNCSNNIKIDLTDLPETIEYLECESCELTTLNMLPPSLKFLNCSSFTGLFIMLP